MGVRADSPFHAVAMSSFSPPRATRARERALVLVTIALVVASRVALAQSTGPLDTASVRDVDRIRLLEARRIASRYADSVWPGWSGAPFNVLLIEGEREFLLWHPQPPAGFTRVGRDERLDTDVFVRKRVLPPRMDATFVLTAAIPTIVIGTAEAGGRSASGWVITLLHEHFHQWQMSRPDYNRRLLALGLARGDSTGMWSLDYAFPYADSTVQRRFAEWSTALRDAARDSAGPRAERFATVVDTRRALRAAISADDDRYLDYQLWQEGIARYTELALARVVAARYEPTVAFRTAEGFRPFADVAAAIERGIFRDDAADLGTRKREAFYPVGATVGLWLDRADPAWRERYLADMFAFPTPGR